jgi:hypothetical protein
VYIREIFNYLYFRILTLFNLFNECVERGAMNYKDKDVAMYLSYGGLTQKPKYPSISHLNSPSTASKVIKISQYKILYNFLSTLKFPDFSRHLKASL